MNPKKTTAPTAMGAAANTKGNNNPMMSQRPDNPYPVDPTGPLTIGSIPEENLGPLFDAAIPPIERLRQAITEVDPADLVAADVCGLLDLIRAAMDSDSEYADRLRADEAVRMRNARMVDLDAESGD